MESKDHLSHSECCPSSQCGGTNRRDFLKLVGLGGLAASGLPVMGGPFTAADFEKLVPADKKLSPEWLRSLFARGARVLYRGKDLEKIGMPIGGICSGQVYLGGDGRLWHWDIFNQPIGTGAEHYASPMAATAPLDQGFALKVTAQEKSEVRPLDRTGFASVSFCGEYPIGQVNYLDPAVPLSISLQAFSPFIPLNVEDSALPATILQFTLKNTGTVPVRAELAGWLENVVLRQSNSFFAGHRCNHIKRAPQGTCLECRVEPPPRAEGGERPAVVFADFEGETYGDWKVEGEAFGTKPARGALGADQRLSGFLGKGLVNSYPASDQPRGKLTSPAFTIEQAFISFLIGGGQHPGETCINLVLDGKVVRTSTGKNTDTMTWDNWDVHDLKGKKAHIEIVDNHSGGWGHIDIDQIEFRDRPRSPGGNFQQQPDFGTMALYLLGSVDEANASVPADKLPASALAGATMVAPESAKVALSDKLVGALSRGLTLQPGQQGQITFIVAWHFPNLSLGPQRQGRHYAKRFASATAVAEYVANHLDRLGAQTRLWHDTWYDSTLPYWFLDRTMANTSILATSTCHWFADGRFYGWEGVGCCDGTCTHVWHYAHAVAHLFPQLERDLRERTDFGLAFQPDSGVIRFRGEGAGLAIDGQSGCILRSYREHRMSADERLPGADLAEDQESDGMPHPPGRQWRRHHRRRTAQHAGHRLVRTGGLAERIVPGRPAGQRGDGPRSGRRNLCRSRSRHLRAGTEEPGQPALRWRVFHQQARSQASSGDQLGQRL